MVQNLNVHFTLPENGEITDADSDKWQFGAKKVVSNLGSGTGQNSDGANSECSECVGESLKKEKKMA